MHCFNSSLICTGHFVTWPFLVFHFNNWMNNRDQNINKTELDHCCWINDSHNPRIYVSVNGLLYSFIADKLIWVFFMKLKEVVPEFNSLIFTSSFNMNSSKISLFYLLIADVLFRLWHVHNGWQGYMTSRPTLPLPLMWQLSPYAFHSWNIPMHLSV